MMALKKVPNIKKEAFAMSKINFKKVLAVSLLAAIGLTACDQDIQAKPANYDDKLIAFSSDDDIYHNMVSLVEDAYRDGSLPSDVLDEVLYQYAVSVFGRYNKTAKPFNLGEGEITLKAAAADIKAHAADLSQAATAKKFIDEHKAYQSLDDDGNRKEDEASKKSEFDRVSAKWQTIEERISISLYNDIIGGSYSERELFSEKKFLKSLRAGLHKVRNPYELTDGTDMKKDIIFTPSVEDKDVFGNYLIRDNYQSNYALDAAEVQDAAVRYVEEEIVPIIYRTLLVEQYLLDESYTTLGRSYARKVNILAIPTNSNNDKAATYMMKDFVENYVSKGKDVTLATFNKISALNVGTLAGVNGYYKLVNPEEADLASLDADAAKAFMTNLGYELVGTGADAYYKGTDYGDMMMKYLKIKDNVITTDSSAESEFSGSYTYTYDVGKEIEERKLQNKDYTQNGWYIKNGGLTSLPDEIRTRLFNIGVANVLDKEGVADRWTNGAYSVPDGENNLVAKINGKYYLKVASKQAGAKAEDDILFSSSGTYYVVQIEEAISASKLAKDNTTSYASDAKEEIINEVAKIIAADDSYKSLSTKHWLEKAGLKYHDTKVYDYFKENYPDLFEDEDD